MARVAILSAFAWRSRDRPGTGEVLTRRMPARWTFSTRG